MAGAQVMDEEPKAGVVRVVGLALGFWEEAGRRTVGAQSASASPAPPPTVPPSCQPLCQSQTFHVISVLTLPSLPILGAAPLAGAPSKRLFYWLQWGAGRMGQDMQSSPPPLDTR